MAAYITNLKQRNSEFTYIQLQSKRPAAVFYPFGHPTPHAYDDNLSFLIRFKEERRWRHGVD
jgi:hypothetical protein